ncbi:hypothetical protein CLIB1423_21S00474 [[Candida] railenensis]|uniref:Uncharacterized protein n=1 Tax=[Candida] railenensis TaxID=45579 RepID=A0A9P0W0H3_9ASCO|nr:hypothetical protein CLIB1423_21S00474 [[Candida] railenensis]
MAIPNGQYKLTSKSKPEEGRRGNHVGSALCIRCVNQSQFLFSIMVVLYNSLIFNVPKEFMTGSHFHSHNLFLSLFINHPTLSHPNKQYILLSFKKFISRILAAFGPRFSKINF